MRAFSLQGVAGRMRAGKRRTWEPLLLKFVRFTFAFAGRRSLEDVKKAAAPRGRGSVRRRPLRVTLTAAARRGEQRRCILLGCGVVAPNG